MNQFLSESINDHGVCRTAPASGYTGSVKKNTKSKQDPREAQLQLTVKLYIDEHLYNAIMV